MCTIASTALAWNNNMHSLFGVDDANIYFVYMKNIAHGYGFVYSIGGEHVEGFTSLSWTLLGSLFFKISEYPELLLILFNILIISFTLFQLTRFTDLLFSSSSFSIPSIVLLCCVYLIPGFIEWTILSIMETGLWTSLIILLILHIVSIINKESTAKEQYVFSLLLGLLVITRPEAMLWGTFFLISRYVLLYQKTSSFGHSLNKSIIPLSVFICSVIGLLIWRLSYFGYPLPNTYYAKVSSDILSNLKHGIGYIYRFLTANPLSLLSTLAISKILLDRISKKYGNHRYSPVIYILISTILISFAIPLYSGGDHFAYFRFMQSTLPIFYIVLMMILNFYGLTVTKQFAIILCFFAIISSGLIDALAGKSPLKHEWNIAIEGRSLGEKLSQFFIDESTLPSQGVLVAGGTAYTYKGKTIDLMGLNNTVMAHADKIKDKKLLKNHASFNKNVFYQLKPDLFWISGGFSDSSDYSLLHIGEFASKAFKHIEVDNSFKKEYSPCIIQKKGIKQKLHIYASHSFLQRLDTNIYSVLLLN
jgi:hypothetical protein